MSVSLGFCKAQCTAAGPQGNAVMRGAGAARQGPSFPGKWAIMLHGVVLTTRVAHDGESWPGTIFLYVQETF